MLSIVGQSAEKPRWYSGIVARPSAKNPRVAFNLPLLGPRAKIEFSPDRPRVQIHLATLSACPQIVPFSVPLGHVQSYYVFLMMVVYAGSYCDHFPGTSSC